MTLPGTISTLPPELRDPVFAQPWQAQAFALVVGMHSAGLFAWKDWAALLAKEIQNHPAHPDESANDTYYRQWVNALEHLVAVLGLATDHDVTTRAQAWRQAWFNTPHGHSVALAHALCPPDHIHLHTPKHTPVTVIPASKETTP